MSKWGTKSDFAGAIIFGTLGLSYIIDNKYVLLFGVIISGVLLLSSFYDNWKKKNK